MINHIANLFKNFVLRVQCPVLQTPDYRPISATCSILHLECDLIIELRENG